MSKWHPPAWLLAVLLGLVTATLYWPATSNDFVNLDDPEYVTANPHVQGGLTFKNLRWAGSNLVCCNWHPVTVWTHMMDCQLFGLKPWGHHLTNIVLHALNAGLLFLLLQMATGAKWRSLLVAALFALHPLRVESVAWVAERKDVLSGFFFLLTLWAYGRYVEGKRLEAGGWRLEEAGRGQPRIEHGLNTEGGRGKGEGRMQTSEPNDTAPASSLQPPAWYLFALLFFALGLMSKPMLVTLPFVLLLLDFWPLGRMRSAEGKRLEAGGWRLEEAGRGQPRMEHGWNTDGGRERAGCTVRSEEAGDTHPATRTTPSASRSMDQSQIANRKSQMLFPLLLEKLPFFALAALASVVTLVAQRGAMPGAESLALGARVANALVSYVRYVGKLFWPADLAVWYPHPGRWPWGVVLLAGGALAGLSLLLWVRRRQSPWLLVGWLWFVGTLVPVIGLIQVGAQAMADRYTYLPSVGVLILLVWGASELARPWRYQGLVWSVVGGSVVLCCAALNRQQLGYWKHSETLFEHALAVTRGNWLAHINLGIAFHHQGRFDEALGHFREAIRLNPRSADAHSNLGAALHGQGHADEAIRELQTALQLNPNHADAHYNLGNALAARGQADQAIRQFQAALRLKPGHAGAHNNLGLALAGKGQTEEAIPQFHEALRLDPGHAEARLNLGNAFAGKGQLPEAIREFQEALRLKPNYAHAHFNLGVVFAQSGRIEDAIGQFQEAVRLEPDFAVARHNLDYLLARSPDALGALAASLDTQGQYAEAIRFYRAGLEVQPDYTGILNNLAWLLASCPDAAFRDGPEAVRLASRACELTGYSQPLLIGTLAAAYAEAGRFEDARSTAAKAIALAEAAGQADLAARNRELLKLYESGKAFHEIPQ